MSTLRSAQQFAFDRLNELAGPVARSRYSGPFPLGVGLTMLEATGRRSGATRARPLLGLRCGNLVLAGTARPSSDWIANLRATPHVDLWIGGSRVPATAEIAPLPIGSLATFRIA